MVLLSCSGTGGGTYAKLANGLAQYNCAQFPPGFGLYRKQHHCSHSVRQSGKTSSGFGFRERRVRTLCHLNVRQQTWQEIINFSTVTGWRSGNRGSDFQAWPQPSFICKEEGDSPVAVGAVPRGRATKG